MRVNKYLASLGIASRRKADEMILAGKVQLNGKILTEVGKQIIPEEDAITVNSKEVGKKIEKVYLMLNKPKGIISTVSDDRGRKTVLDIVTTEPGVFPVGRLDEDSTGLILLTNDGDLAFRLTHPKYEVEKTYRLLVHIKMTTTQMEKLRKGVKLEDGMTAPAKINKIWGTNEETVLEVKIHEGRKRQIRRMCEVLGLPLVELERVAIGSLLLGEMEYGKYRKLSEKEIEGLKTSVGLI
jgi:pseudouridine synthase